MAKNNKIPKLFSLRELAKHSEVPYSKLYHNNAGTYQSLDESERTKLFNAAQDKFEELAAYLGFTINGQRIKKA